MPRKVTSKPRAASPRRPLDDDESCYGWKASWLPVSAVTRRLVSLAAKSCRVSEAEALEAAVYWYAVEWLKLKADVGSVVRPPKGRRR